MTSVLLRPNGTLSDFVDGAGFFRFREREWQTVVDAGFIGASVYITGAFGVPRACIEAAWNVGIVLSPNVERSPSLFLGGYESGKWLAQEGIRELFNLGFQGEAHVFASGVDFSATAPMFPALDDAHRGWLDEFDKVGWRWPATYGPKGYMQRLPLFDWWPERARIWHWGGDNRGINDQPIYEFADCKQWYGHKPEVYGPRHNVGPIPAGIDENTHVAQPIKFWTGYGSDPIVIIPQGGDMPEFRHNSQGWVFQIDHGVKYIMTGDYFYNILNGCLYGQPPPKPRPDGQPGVIAYPADDALLEALPNATSGGSSQIRGIHIHSVPGDAEVF